MVLRKVSPVKSLSSKNHTKTMPSLLQIFLFDTKVTCIDHRFTKVVLPHRKIFPFRMNYKTLIFLPDKVYYPLPPLAATISCFSILLISSSFTPAFLNVSSPFMKFSSKLAVALLTFSIFFVSRFGGCTNLNS